MEKNKECCWFACKVNDKNSDVSLFCIPEDGFLRKQWIKNIIDCHKELPVKLNYSCIYICENHFSLEDFLVENGRKKIKPSAVPRIKSGSGGEISAGNENTEDANDRIIFNEDSKEHIVVELGIDIPEDEGTEEDKSFSKESKDDSVLCHKCSIEFKSCSAFRRHWRELHKDQPLTYACVTCKKQYKGAGKLRKHKFTAHEEVKESCPICSKVFGSEYLWNVHVHNHNANKPYTCDKCDKSFLTPFRLSKHSRTHIPLAERKDYECDLCLQKFASRSGWESHASLHTGTRNFKCEVCNKSFRTKGSMSSHKMVHTDERPFPCSKCDKRFRAKNHLIVHDRVHTNARPYACTICPKNFSHRHVWKKHLDMHQNIRNYKCRFCEKAFRDKSKLNVHERIHTGIRPYKCDRCTSAFYESGNLRKHMQKVHKLVDSNKLPCKILALNDEDIPQFSHTTSHNILQPDQIS